MCNRIEDLIEKARHYEDLWHEALDENARLKAEVERLTWLQVETLNERNKEENKS